jgi:hypothetical protein
VSFFSGCIATDLVYLDIGLAPFELPYLSVFESVYHECIADGIYPFSVPAPTALPEGWISTMETLDADHELVSYCDVKSEGNVYVGPSQCKEAGRRGLATGVWPGALPGQATAELVAAGSCVAAAEERASCLWS